MDEVYLGESEFRNSVNKELDKTKQFVVMELFERSDTKQFLGKNKDGKTIYVKDLKDAIKFNTYEEADDFMMVYARSGGYYDNLAVSPSR